MPLIYVISALFLDFLKLVDAKICMRSDDNSQTFPCGLYEYCCGTRCCRSPIITFYQMWYFWLMVFLTILFCSGGGWWYRLRNQDAYVSPSMGQRVAHSIVHPPRGPRIIAATTPMPTIAPYNVQQPVPPPPPYYGPPPSYETVVNQNQNLQNQNLYLNQQNQYLHQQNQHLNQQNQNSAPSQQN